MGTTDSKPKLGETVMATRHKLAEDKKIDSERESKAAETIKVIMKSVDESFKSCSPFLESILLIAWQTNSEECGKIILDACKRVLTGPINKNEYEWFIKYVFPSSVWRFKSKTNRYRYMYEELIDIVNNMQQNIVGSKKRNGISSLMVKSYIMQGIVTLKHSKHRYQNQQTRSM